MNYIYYCFEVYFFFLLIIFIFKIFLYDDEIKKIYYNLGLVMYVC